MKKNFTLFLLLSFLAYESYATSIVKWNFNRPFELSDISESDIPVNNGISTESASTWMVTTPSVGGADEGGYQTVSGWDFGDNPESYFLFPDITIPDEYKEISISLYLKSGFGAPKEYNLEISTDKQNWTSIAVFTMVAESIWEKHSAETIVPQSVSVVSFRIRANSEEGMGWMGSLSSMGNGSIDVFEVIDSGSVKPAESFSGGDGSEASPFLISSKTDMESLAAAVNEGESYLNTHFLLTCNLTGSNDTITTLIGETEKLSFKGVFDGGMHEVAVNQTGLFGWVMHGTIKNLGVSGYIQSVNASSYSDRYVGGICGYLFNGSITDCYNKASISVKAGVFESIHTGGICGRNDNGSISNCYNIGELTVEASVSSMGGICGRNDNNYGKTTENCFAANKQIINNSGMLATARICGNSTNYTTYVNCYALATMLVNDNIVTDGEKTNKNGQDEEIESFKNQQWIEENLGWDFNDTWRIPQNGGFPVLKNVTDPVVSNITYPIDVFIGSFAGYLTISGIADASVTIYDMQGKAIFKQTNISYEEIVQTSNWTKGVYLITVQKDNSKVTKKIVVY